VCEEAGGGGEGKRGGPPSLSGTVEEGDTTKLEKGMRDGCSPNIDDDDDEDEDEERVATAIAAAAVAFVIDSLLLLSIAVAPSIIVAIGVVAYPNSSGGMEVNDAATTAGAEAGSDGMM
jgi:hypothetical protein